MSANEFDAIILAGGRGSRLGGLDKSSLDLAGRRLVDRVIVAARSAGAERVIVSGPVEAGSLADRAVREDPPFSGPLAALGAALAAVGSPWLLVLSCDLVHPGRVIGELLSARSDSGDGVILVDEDGAPQWLCAHVRAEALRAAMPTGSLIDLPLRAALGQVSLRRVVARQGTVADIDTPAQLRRARREVARAQSEDPSPQSVERNSR